MDQRTIDFERPERNETAVSAHAGRLGFSPSEIAVLRVLLSAGTSVPNSQQTLCFVAITERNLAARTVHEQGQPERYSKTSVRKAAASLVARGVLAQITPAPAAKTPTTWVVNWTAFWRLTPPETPATPDLASVFDTETETDQWSPCGHPVVTPVRVSVRSVDLKSVDPVSVSVDPCPSARETRAPAARPESRWAGELPRPSSRRPRETLLALRRPWSRADGLTDEELRWCVRARQGDVLRALYEDGVRAGWIVDTEDARLRFLTVCHHVTESPGLRSPMGCLIARVRRGLDVERTRQASDQWAGDMLAGRVPQRV